MEATIRLATAEDINVLAALGTTTCYEAYFELDPSRDLADYCARVYSPEAVRAEFDDPNSTFLIAELNERSVGFVKLRENNAVECVADKHAIEVQRIYVLERLKGHRIGNSMMERAIEIAREKGYTTLWLGVWDQNIRAQSFYEKLGMSNIGTTGFSDGKNDFINFVYAINV